MCIYNIYKNTSISLKKNKETYSLRHPADGSNPPPAQIISYAGKTGDLIFNQLIIRHNVSQGRLNK